MTAAQLTLFSTFLFGPLNMLSALLVGKRRMSGWAVLIAVQLGMVAFGVATGYWGFVMNLGMAGVGVYNFIAWRRQAMNRGNGAGMAAKSAPFDPTQFIGKTVYHADGEQQGKCISVAREIGQKVAHVNVELDTPNADGETRVKWAWTDTFFN